MSVGKELIFWCVVACVLGLAPTSALSGPQDGIMVIGAKQPSGTPSSPVPASPTDGMHIFEAPKRAPVPTLGLVPIGSIIAWASSMPNTPDLPGAWVECDGQEIKDASSPYDGQSVPNLNGGTGESQRFLRGATSSGATGGSEEHYHGADRSQKYGDSRKPVGATGRTRHVPPYYEVVWIIRIK